MFLTTRKLLAFLFLISFVSVPNVLLANDLEENDNLDKYENFNRSIFEFNNKIDDYVFSPVARGYRAITNQFTRDRVSGALINVKEPVSAVNHLLQGDIISSATNIGRFALNTTLGLLGTFDVAKGFNLNPKNTSLDETLSTWCIKDGPYLVLPFVGGGTPRAFIGDLVDGYANPLYIATYNDANVKDKLLYSYATVNAVSKREAALDLIDDFKKSSVDFYATARSAYLQNRTTIKTCRAAKTVSANNYDFDMSDDED